MPMSGSNYVAPTWVDNAPPALDAAELQAICNTVQENQGDVASLQSVVSSLNSLVNGKAQVQLISYVGTGTYGATYPCSITASFPIDVALYLGAKSNSGSWLASFNETGNSAVATSALKTSYVSQNGLWQGTNETGSNGKRSFDGKTITWYHESTARAQLNNSYQTYYFLCIG